MLSLSQARDSPHRPSAASPRGSAKVEGGVPNQQFALFSSPTPSPPRRGDSGNRLRLKEHHLVTPRSVLSSANESIPELTAAQSSSGLSATERGGSAPEVGQNPTRLPTFLKLLSGMLPRSHPPRRTQAVKRSAAHLAAPRRAQSASAPGRGPASSRRGDPSGRLVPRHVQPASPAPPRDPVHHSSPSVLRQLRAVPGPQASSRTRGGPPRAKARRAQASTAGLPQAPEDAARARRRRRVPGLPPPRAGRRRCRGTQRGREPRISALPGEGPRRRPGPPLSGALRGAGGVTTEAKRRHFGRPSRRGEARRDCRPHRPLTFMAATAASRSAPPGN